MSCMNDKIPRFRFSIKFSRKILTFKLLDRLHYKKEKEVSRNESEASVKIKQKKGGRKSMKEKMRKNCIPFEKQYEMREYRRQL